LELVDHTVADAILDRLVHNAYKIDLKGDSMRKVAACLNQDEKARSLKRTLIPKGGVK